jgi:organic hydroperoxide reductase OsmC/OhrA
MMKFLGRITMAQSHSYRVGVAWRGNRGRGTASYAGYERAHEISADGKPIIPGSSDRAFRGDSSCYNPEDLLLAALAACHMLSYLHVCADSGVVVTEYVDEAEGVMVTTKDGGGAFHGSDVEAHRDHRRRE